MARQRQYWVVSPNVKNQEKTVGDWKKEILRSHYAIMGWSPDDYHGHQIGPKFANDVKIGDIILIARRHKWEPDVVGFGVVKGRIRERRFPMSGDPVYVRALDPFIPLKQVPKGIPLLDILPSNRAMVQRHPEKYDAHRKICDWMEERLGLEGRKSDSDTITERGVRKSRTFGYKVTKPERVTAVRRREAKLLEDYGGWLRKHGRHLSVLKYGRIECDAWEQERQNLIEAKGSTSREDIRMAAGQLFDYAFQMREKFEKPKMAILLPKKPALKSVEWLEPLGIKTIWRSGKSFVDNADGQFI